MKQVKGNAVRSGNLRNKQNKIMIITCGDSGVGGKIKPRICVLWRPLISKEVVKGSLGGLSATVFLTFAWSRQLEVCAKNKTMLLFLLLSGIVTIITEILKVV